MSARPVPASELWLIAFGFCVWCSALVLSYAIHSVGCAFTWPAWILRLSLTLTIFVHLVVIGWFLRSCSRSPSDSALGPIGSFLHWVTVWTLISAFVTVIFTLGPALLLTMCD
jgi:hypothetical protein